MRKSEKKLREALAEIEAEYKRATAIYPPFNSTHEAYAVLLEEVDEFWDDVKANRANRVELIQIGAMVVRSLCELELRRGLTCHEGEAQG